MVKRQDLLSLRVLGGKQMGCFEAFFFAQWFREEEGREQVGAGGGGMRGQRTAEAVLATRTRD